MRNLFICFLVHFISPVPTMAAASYYANHWHQDYPFAVSYNQRILRSRRSSMALQHPYIHCNGVLLAARKTSKSRRPSSSLPQQWKSGKRLDKFVIGTFILSRKPSVLCSGILCGICCWNPGWSSYVCLAAGGNLLTEDDGSGVERSTSTSERAL